MIGLNSSHFIALAVFFGFVVDLLMNFFTNLIELLLDREDELSVL